LRELRSDISELARNSEEIEARLDSLIDNQELGNALLKKSAMSSRELVKDVNRIKELQAYDFYGYKAN
jgi:hypothetical protein